MLTLKIKPYNKCEVENLAKLLGECILTLQDKYCNNDCNSCPVHHLCVDLQSAELFAWDTTESRRGE